MGTIDNVEVFLIKVPLKASDQIWSSQTTFTNRKSLLVKITAGPLSGWGEAGHFGPGEPVVTVIEKVVKPLLLGKKVQPGRIYEELYAYSRDFGQRGTYIEAISGIDIALWDLLGKQLSVPVCELLGGAFRDRVRVYATGCCYRHHGETASDIDIEKDIANVVSEAGATKEAGFGGLKMLIGLLSVEDDARRVAAVRNKIGPNMKLMVDANHAYSVHTAGRMLAELEKIGVHWFEEPIIPEDIAGYKQLRSAARTVAISGGECVFTRYGFRDLFSHNGSPCVDIAQPDLTACGGLSEFMKISSLASSFGVKLIPHVWGSAVVLAAALHAVATLPPSPFSANPQYMENEPVIEFDWTPSPLRDDIVKDQDWSIQNGTVGVPNKLPGLGIIIDEDAVRKMAAETSDY